jgi:hypothetical protein
LITLEPSLLTQELGLPQSKPKSMPSRKRHTQRVTRADEEFERAMFYEYREENARDMEREAYGGW